MGGGISHGKETSNSNSRSSTSSSSHFTFAYLKMEMEKTINQAPRPVKHKIKKNILIIEGRRYIFNPFIANDADLQGAISPEEFISLVEKINEAGIRILVGQPYTIPAQDRFSMSEKAIVTEIGRLNRFLQERNIFFELRAQGSSSYLNKTNLSSTIHLVLPSNTLTNSLMSSIEEITSGYTDEDLAPLDESMSNNQSDSPRISGMKPPRDSIEIAATLRANIKKKQNSLPKSTPKSPVKQPTTLPGPGRSGTTFGPGKGSGKGSSLMEEEPATDEFDFDTNSTPAVVIRVSNSRAELRPRNNNDSDDGFADGFDVHEDGDKDGDVAVDEAYYEEMQSQVFKANIALLADITSHRVPEHVLETHLLRAEGDVDLAAQTLLIDENDNDYDDEEKVFSQSNQYPFAQDNTSGNIHRQQSQHTLTQNMHSTSVTRLRMNASASNSSIISGPRSTSDSGRAASMGVRGGGGAVLDRGGSESSLSAAMMMAVQDTTGLDEDEDPDSARERARELDQYREHVKSPTNNVSSNRIRPSVSSSSSTTMASTTVTVSKSASQSMLDNPWEAEDDRLATDSVYRRHSMRGDAGVSVRGGGGEGGSNNRAGGDGEFELEAAITSDDMDMEFALDDEGEGEDGGKEENDEEGEEENVRGGECKEAYDDEDEEEEEDDDDDGVDDEKKEDKND